MIRIEQKIAKLVAKENGRAFYVGGYVRDKLLGISNKDVDIEIHGVEPKKLEEILKSVGSLTKYGSNFGIYSLKDCNIDIALPRKEENTGRGHKDFEVYVDPYLGYKKACQRRDFTINSMMMDVVTSEIVDPFNGQKDLKKNIIKHVDSSSFVEDPLRVLRAAQFASRFEFKIAKSTIELCSSIDITTLSKERVEEELKKALLKSNKPSLFFESLRKMNQLDYWFNELTQLIGLKQDKLYHPEKDVYIHTMMVLDEAVKYRDKVDNPYAFMLLALCHDLGKIVTTEKINNRIHSYEHETKGIPIIKKFLKRFTNNKYVIKYVCNLTELHMKPNVLYKDNSSIKASNKMFYEAIAKKDLIHFALCDQTSNVKEKETFLFKRLNEYNKTMSKPYVTGEDLIKNGLKPNENFKKYLAYANKLRLSNIDKESALKQTLAYAKKEK